MRPGTNGSRLSNAWFSATPLQVATGAIDVELAAFTTALHATA